MEEEKHNVEYSCGCVHQIKNDQGFWKATGNNTDCKLHRINNNTL